MTTGRAIALTRWKRGRLWYNRNECLVLVPWFLARLLKTLASRVIECLSYGNATGGWELLSNFWWGLLAKNTEASLESWNFQPRPLSSGKGSRTRDWVSHPRMTQWHLHHEISMKTPVWWGSGSLQTGEHLTMLVRPEGTRKRPAFPFKTFTRGPACFSLEWIVSEHFPPFFF